MLVVLHPGMTLDMWTQLLHDVVHCALARCAWAIFVRSNKPIFIPPSSEGSLPEFRCHLNNPVAGPFVCMSSELLRPLQEDRGLSPCYFVLVSLWWRFFCPGITSLLGSGVYMAAYPLHDVSTSKIFLLSHILLTSSSFLAVSVAFSFLSQGDINEESTESNDRKVRRRLCRLSYLCKSPEIIVWSQIVWTWLWFIQLLYEEWANYGVFFKYQPVGLVRWELSPPYANIFLSVLDGNQTQDIWYFCLIQEVFWWKDRSVLCLVGSVHTDADPGLPRGCHSLPVRMCNRWRQHTQVTPRVWVWPLSRDLNSNEWEGHEWMSCLSYRAVLSSWT